MMFIVTISVIGAVGIGLIVFLGLKSTNTTGAPVKPKFVVVHNDQRKRYEAYSDTWFFRVFGSSHCRPFTQAYTLDECIEQAQDRVNKYHEIPPPVGGTYVARYQRTEQGEWKQELNLDVKVDHPTETPEDKTQ